MGLTLFPGSLTITCPSHAQLAIFYLLHLEPSKMLWGTADFLFITFCQAHSRLQTKECSLRFFPPPACTLNEHIRLPLTDQISIVWLHPQGRPASKNCFLTPTNNLCAAVVKCPSLPQIIRRGHVTTCRVICHLHAQPCLLCSFLVLFNLLVLFPKIFLRHFLTYPRLTLTSLISPVTRIPGFYHQAWFVQCWRSNQGSQEPCSSFLSVAV